MERSNNRRSLPSDVWLSSRNRRLIMTEVIYKHYKKGGQYIIINAGEMQINDVWGECVIYQCLNSKKIYVREAVEFDLKFSA